MMERTALKDRRGFKGQLGRLDPPGQLGAQELQAVQARLVEPVPPEPVALSDPKALLSTVTMEKMGSNPSLSPEPLVRPDPLAPLGAPGPQGPVESPDQSSLTSVISRLRRVLTHT